jgi:hypothetical protein
MCLLSSCLTTIGGIHIHTEQTAKWFH